MLVPCLPPNCRTSRTGRPRWVVAAGVDVWDNRGSGARPDTREREDRGKPLTVLHLTLDSLSPRERKLVQLAVQTGVRDHKSLAALLGISPSTVGTHLASIHRKLGTHSTTEMLRAVELIALNN